MAMLAATPVLPPPDPPPEPPPEPPPDPPPEPPPDPPLEPLLDPEPPAMEAPFSATLVDVFAELASTAKPSTMTEEFARAMRTPSGISATVSLMPMLSAKETPMPVDDADAPPCLGSAVTVLSVTLCASTLSAPPVRVTLVAPGVVAP